VLRLLPISFLLFTSIVLFSCSSRNGEKKDTSELWAKSQTQGDIIARSGTTFKQTSREGSMAEALDDAENRLRSGGGLLSKQGGINLLDMGNTGNENRSSSLVINPINPYLWRATLETINFMPIASADPFGGIIITDWYSTEKNPKERCKLNIFIRGAELKTENLKVNSFCENKINNDWVNSSIKDEDNIKIENAILNKAKKFKLSKS
tara:strand:+ start:592 stop:1215 length:624 start_codon:yes stop_codon:yes gene_type:complete